MKGACRRSLLACLFKQWHGSSAQKNKKALTALGSSSILTRTLHADTQQQQHVATILPRRPMLIAIAIKTVAPLGMRIWP